MSRVVLIIFLTFAARKTESRWNDCNEAVSFEPDHPNYIQNITDAYNMTVADGRLLAQRNLNDMDRQFDSIYRDDRLDLQWNQIPQLSRNQATLCRRLLSRSYERSVRSYILELKQKYDRLEASYNDLQKELKELDPIVKDAEQYRGEETLFYQAQSIHKHICILAKLLSEEFSNHLESSKTIWDNYLIPADDCVLYLPNDVLSNLLKDI